jgi:Acyl-CoA reductase (LuxC)
LQPRRQLLGFIMPGNVPGGGIHELFIALAAGCAAIVKTSSSDPVFFSELAATLREADRRLGTDFGARLEVFDWERKRVDLTGALLRNCDLVIAMGDDATIADLEALTQRRSLIAFGGRVSGAVVLQQALQGIAMAQTADALALDCAMFDQRGCLSPHHIFVEEHAREFAAELAAAFARLAPLFGRNGAVRKLQLQDAAAVRRARETARWGALGGATVELWEDSQFEWTVVFDEHACFTPSPGFCTLYVSPFSGRFDLERRLQPAWGKIECLAIANGESAFSNPAALALINEVLTRSGATYTCAPGRMQSPPLEWPHGGGDFVRLFVHNV